MYLDYTEYELSSKFDDMNSEEIVDYLMQEGLTLKPIFKDIPVGVYRREHGSDLITNYTNISFDLITLSRYPPFKPIDWEVDEEGGDWWIQVLDKERNPVLNGLRFRMDRNGKRIG